MVLTQLINGKPDSKLTEDDIRFYGEKLQRMKPKNIQEYAMALQLPQNTVWYWVKNPSPKKRGRYYKRRSLFEDYFSIHGAE